MTWIDPTLYFLIGALPVWQTTHDWVGALLGGLVALKAWRSTGSTKAAIANAAASAEQTATQLAAGAMAKLGVK